MTDKSRRLTISEELLKRRGILREESPMTDKPDTELTVEEWVSYIYELCGYRLTADVKAILRQGFRLGREAQREADLRWLKHDAQGRDVTVAFPLTTASISLAAAPLAEFPEEMREENP